MGHDAHFDGEPATQLAPDEAPTPNWVPVLGLCLLLAAGVYWVASGASAAPAAQQPAPSGTAAAAAPRAAGPGAMTAAARPTAAVAGSARPPMTPEQAEQLRKRMEDMKKRREAAGNATAPATPPPAAAPAPPR